MLTLVRVGRGKESPAFRRLFTSQFMPGGTKEQADWFNELQRMTVSGEMPARMRQQRVRCHRATPADERADARAARTG
jgi:hypothetical protein